MGSLDVKIVSNQKQLDDFTRRLLTDVRALEYLIENNMFTNIPAMIGAEQEICLVNEYYKPAPMAMEVLEALNDPDFTTELAKFNLEVNLPPLPFTGDCFSAMESNIDAKLDKLEKVLLDKDLRYIITGILPTLRKFDLEIENLTPLKRYMALMKAISKLRGTFHELKIKGIDELNLQHDTAMLEACNTSFQVHLQVDPSNFVEKYNSAQILIAPVLAIGSNSPMLFGRRLWSETRIALFQQSIDTRRSSEHLRDRSPRVMFGNKWLENSVLELYKEDVARFRIMLMTQNKDNSLAEVKEGRIPKLGALSVHNSTVYRWNRPCYGISSDGKPHLRIENRTLPSGPTVVDEVANSAFWLGMMSVFEDYYPNVHRLMDFDDARINFISAAFKGMDTELKWINGKKYPVSELIKKELLPIAREGLENQGINSSDIDRYLGIIEERNTIRQNGSTWLLNSFSALVKEDLGKEEIPVALTANMHTFQSMKIPVHKWELAKIRDMKKWHPTGILVEEFMTTDLFTVHKDDIPELVVDMMDWQRIRFTPVEDKKGRLIGLISSRILMRYLIDRNKETGMEEKKVKDLMIKDPITISPESTVFDAMYLFREHKIGCLPVVKKDKLVGIVTEGNFLGITKTLLKVLEESNKKDE
ncbi:MAG: CBS domain-containing protein [Cyclobacteriaceae bacterium]|nr:CBS domain-containing protein [Cyclobacteriaceae bacterium]